MKTQSNPDMTVNRTRPPRAESRQQLQTAVERIDAFLNQNRQEYDTARINLVRRVLFGHAAIDAIEANESQST